MELRRADKLLLDCLKANGNLDPESLASLERLTIEDWNQVVQQSIRHTVAPLLYFRLKQSGLDVPTTTFEKLHELYLRTVASNLHLYHELSKILQVLKDASVPVVVLKGAHLAEIVYGYFGLRSMSDVDLLVKKKDLSRAQKRLMDAGYSPSSRQINLDLQWNIESSADYLSIDMEKVWERARPDIIAGVEVQVLCPEDLILHICLHLSFQHLFQLAGVRSLCDIRESIEHYNNNIKWFQVCSRASEWGVRNSVYLTLLLAREMMGANVPDDVMENLKPDEFEQRVKSWAVNQILSAAAAPAISPFFFQLWKPGSLYEKISLLRKLLLPPPEIISQDYPAPFGSARNYLYYAVRLKDHFRRYARVTRRILRGEEYMTLLVKRQNRNITMREWLAPNYGRKA
jgi:hypothetical protein